MSKITKALLLVVMLVPGLALAQDATDPLPPEVTIVQPVDGEYICYTVEVIAEAFAEEGILEVVFLVDGTPVFSDMDEPYIYELGIEYLDGADHMLHATAYSFSGDIGESQDVLFSTGVWDPADGVVINGDKITITEAGLSGRHAVRILDKNGNIVKGHGTVTFKNGTATIKPGDEAIRKLRAGGSVEVSK